MTWFGSDFPIELLAAFRAHAVPGPAGDCWPWPDDQRMANEYGRFSWNGMQGYAHRLSYAAHVDRDVLGHVVRHRCDNPPCWNPECLIIGTQWDNIQDAVHRDRVCHSDARAIKLTSELAREIFSAYHSGASIASLMTSYGINSTATIHKIAQRTLWRRATADLVVNDPSRSRHLQGSAHPGWRRTPELEEEVIRRVGAGQRYRDVAQACEVGYGTVCRIMKSRGR
jgi:hypothetical protein